MAESAVPRQERAAGGASGGSGGGGGGTGSAALAKWTVFVSTPTSIQRRAKNSLSLIRLSFLFDWLSYTLCVKLFGRDVKINLL